LGVHSNIKAFIKKTSNSLNVVYTFSPIMYSMKFNFEVRNEIFGQIKGQNSKSIYIKYIKTENQFEKEVIEFYKSENKLLLIHIEETDSQNLEFIIIFLERLEKEKQSNEKNKKMIILLNYLKRKKDEFNKDIFIPNISKFEQTFIDNLFGKDMLITEIVNQNIKELYYNTDLINIDEVFKNELFSCFKKINYIFQDISIDQDQYIKQITENILKNEDLILLIKNRIIDEIERVQNMQLEDEENINNKEKDNIYDNIFENKQFEPNKDFMSILSKELEDKFIEYLSRFIINSENQAILSSFSKNLPEYAKKYGKKY
jgi:hypothetical protein